MRNKTTALLLIFSGLIAIALIVYFTFFYGRQKAEIINIPPPQNTVEDIIIQNKPEAPADSGAAVIEFSENTEEQEIADSLEMAKAAVNRLAVSFAERYGTYSNQSNFGNLRDSFNLMSATMRASSEVVIKKGKGSEYPPVYYGITTKAGSSQILTFDNDNGVAEILVKTFRAESSGTAEKTNNFNQEIIIRLVKEGGVWRVGAADWQ